MARKSRKNRPDQKAAVKPDSVKSWKAGLYIRLSVEDRGSHGYSLETQQSIMVYSMKGGNDTLYTIWLADSQNTKKEPFV